jgi:UDP-glucuronate 4-epimerase
VRLLVTGAAGFIGSHLVDRLLADGHAVVGLDNLDPFYDPGLKRSFLADASDHPSFHLVEGDVRDPEALERAARISERLRAGARVGASELGGPEVRGSGEDPKAASGAPFDAVVHLAAVAGVRPSIAEPVRYESVNVGGTARLLEFCRERGVDRVVFGSSSSVYGNTDEVPFREDQDVGRPISPYAATKRAAELLCHTAHHLHGTAVLALRFFTVYGPRQRPDLAIHKFCRLMADGRPITRYGDGTSERDYTYVDDVVEGIVAGLAWLERDPGAFEIVNLGNSDTVQLSRLIELTGRAMGAEPEIEELPEQPGDVERTRADVSKAERLLGWRPTTGIEEGVERFVGWFREYE